jgi:hypothetical protein
MAIEVKYSKNFDDIEKRLKRIPHLVEETMYTVTKKDATDFIRAFRSNIKFKRLSLTPLHPKTIGIKEKLGYSKPKTPLYGAGDDKDNSYINMFGLKKIKNGWKVYPRWAQHHRVAIQLRELLIIHEYGAIIETKDGGLQRIPPRPVVFQTYRDSLNKRKKKDNSKEIKKAINQYIQISKDHLFKKINEGALSIREELIIKK